MRTEVLTRGPAPVLLFTGKGGVGKTTVACATAVQLAASGKRTLLVSTDPASNLDEVLGTDLASGDIVPVSGLPGLDAANVDPDDAARRYRERVVGPFRGVLPDIAVASIEEQLSGACTLEVAAFDRFVALLAGPAGAVYDHLVFDTAPTGHTLRLLELPAAWTTFLDENTTGTSCIGPLSGLQEAQAAYREALEILRDQARAETVLVARPEVSSLAEAARAGGELAALGILPTRLVLNAIPGELDTGDPVAAALVRRAREALAALPEPLASLERIELPLVAEGPIGIEALSHFGRPAPPARAEADLGRTGAGDAVPPSVQASPHASPYDGWDVFVDELAEPGAGVILTMGKGGVGKSTVASALAVALARRGCPVHLTTTDPAGRFDLETEDLPGTFRISRIDPAKERAAYAAEVMATAGAGLDDRGRALLEEDLRSPCTEEIAVFRAFAAAVGGGEDGFVVIDTAPTGHTLLLMDAAEAYHRDVLRRPGTAPEAVRSLLPRLRDPSFARVLVVTLPEATPIHEAAALHADLERAGVRPYAWVANQCFTGLDLSDPLLRARRSAEAPWLDEAARVGGTLITLPWRADASHSTGLPLSERITR